MKVLLISNKLTVEVQDDINSAFSYLKSKTPLEYKLSYLKTDFVTQYKSFGVGNFWGTTGSKEKIAPLLKEPYDVIIFLYGVQGYNVGAGGVLTGWTLFEGLNGAEFIEIPCSPYGDAVKFIDRAISHEVLHALCKILARKGRPVVDEMDTTKDGQTYLHNDNPNHPDGNYARTLKNLAPYWNVFTITKPPVVTTPPICKKDTTPIVLVTRNGDDGMQTLGTLECGTFKCNTLERPWKNNAINISCIPKGEYTVKWTFSTKFMRYTYEVKNVPKRSGIRFHLGNYFTDIAGCILLGSGYKDLNKDGRLDIINSTVTIKAFETLLNKQDFKLIIK